MLAGRSISSVKQGLRILTVTGKQRLATRHVSASCQCHAKQKHQEDEGPIPFSSSKAASWSMTESVVLPDVPWYQAFSIGISLGVFLVYFLFLREENDLDVELNYSLFERVPNLEEHQVKVALDYNRRQGKDTRELEERLAELQRNKQAFKDSS